MDTRVLTQPVAALNAQSFAADTSFHAISSRQTTSLRVSNTSLAGDTETDRLTRPIPASDQVELSEQARLQRLAASPPSDAQARPERHSPSGPNPPLDSQPQLNDPSLSAYIELIISLAGDDERAEANLERVLAYQRTSQTQETAQAPPAPPQDQAAAEAESRITHTLRIEGQEVQVALPSNANLERVLERFEAQTGVAAQVVESDPLVLDLDGDGLELSTIEEGVMFDVDGDGETERTAFARGDDAFLALDRNQNGRIDGGLELFGDQHGAADGFAELRRFDDNADGLIDARDRVFDQLRLYRELNGDGVSQTSELSTLRQAGIASLRLDAQTTDETIAGNRLSAIGHFTRNDGSTGLLGDVWLQHQA